MNTTKAKTPMSSSEQALLSQWRSSGERLLKEIVKVAAIPSPTFDEGGRGKYLAKWFQEAGLDPTMDETGNVFVRIDGDKPGPLLLVTAHMDNVFSHEQHRRPVERDGLLFGPGVRDNAAAVGELLLLAEWWKLNPPSQGSIIFAATVQEEGLGNLAGIRALMNAFGQKIRAVIVIDGNLGWLVHAGVGSKRWKVSVAAEGGHSWLNAGNASAIHGLIEALNACLLLKKPNDPAVTFNVGTIEGGTSVNAIATHASALLDVRSVSGDLLYEMSSTIEQTLQEYVQRCGCALALEIVGQRPGGYLPPDHPFVGTISRVLADLGIRATHTSASTEANIPLSLGLPAVSIGSSVGYRMHTTEEYLEISTLVPGLCQVGLAIHRTLSAAWLLKGN